MFAGAGFEGVRWFPVTAWRRQGLGMGSGVLKMYKKPTCTSFILCAVDP